MPKLKLGHAFVAVLIMLAMLAQGTWALAGTTGNITGQVTDSTTGKAVAGAKVTVVSPSQSGSTTTDASGHFVFLALTPDTYTVSVQKDGYAPVSLSGVTVFADQTQTVAVTTHPELKTIARITSRAAGALVKPGTTSDVYSVNAATAGKVTGLGGGGSLNQAYSAIATMPGAYVPVGQAGWYQAVYIRGGDYDQVGYEVDGVPVNRAFDNYPSNTASALGQQEVQVYTGANPTDSEGQGLSGFINQVIKTGTYPGFGDADLALGAPIFYHKAMVEAGGATPTRNFSYYVGMAGYDQGYRDINQSNGAALSGLWGPPSGMGCPAAPYPQPSASMAPSCYNSSGTYEPGWNVLLPFDWYSTSYLPDRETVANFHFAIPHKHDGGRDDLQLLYQTSQIDTHWYDTSGDFTYSMGAPWLNAVGAINPQTGKPGGFTANESPWNFPYSAVYTGPVNTLVPVGAAPNSFAPVANYCFPSTPSYLCGPSVNIPTNYNDEIGNDIGMLKLQYQKNFGSSAYLRVYGYTVYSNWLMNGPISGNLCCTGAPAPDYELFTHTRGVSASFADQLNAKNLLTLQGSYTNATSTRMNNLTMYYGPYTEMAALVSSANPTNGICYATAGGGGAASAANCDSNATSFTVGQLQAYQNGTGTLPTVAPGTTCGGAACEWYIADNGYAGRDNTVEPRFAAASLTDEFDPTDRLHLNLGVRFDSFQYVPSNTTTGARPFWTNAWNNSYCTNPATPSVAPVEKTNVSLPCSDPSNFGAGYVPATITDVSTTQTYTVFQPRISATYTVNPLNVLRFSFGKYDQAPNAAFEQYDALNQNLPDENANFYTLGFTAPTHPIRPEISYNTDFSWEHQVKGTDLSWKITPFYRTTQDQIEQFYLSVKQNFVSGLNVGKQTSDGVEFQLQKGDFNRNGLSALLSYTYTNAHVKYTPVSNGTTPLTGINAAIAGYNAYSVNCQNNTAKQYGTAVCGSLPGGEVAAPCYVPPPAGSPPGTLPTPVATASACTTADIANPYWNAPIQNLYDPNGSYVPYDLFPAAQPGVGNYSSFVTPHVATLVVNYKHDKWAVTPALQFSAGTRYGSPISTLGFDPASCTGVTATTLDPGRYPYGGSGGAADASTCGQYAVAIPNPATGKFDAVGAFIAPSRLTLATQLSYDISPRVSAVLTLSNIVDTCFGGTKGAWTTPPGVSKSEVCGYGSGYAGLGVLPVGNNYNPASASAPLANVQPFQQQSYYPFIGTLPFNAYLDFKIKL